MLFFFKKTAENQREIRKIVLFVHCLAHTPTQNTHKGLEGFLIIIRQNFFSINHSCMEKSLWRETFSLYGGNLCLTLEITIPCICNENPIYVFFFWELRGLSPNFYIHVSVSDLYIPMIGTHISCSRIGRSMVGIYKSLTDTWMWKLVLWPRNPEKEYLFRNFGIGSLQFVWGKLMSGTRDNFSVSGSKLITGSGDNYSLCGWKAIIGTGGNDSLCGEIFLTGTGDSYSLCRGKAINGSGYYYPLCWGKAMTGFGYNFSLWGMKAGTTSHDWIWI